MRNFADVVRLPPPNKTAIDIHQLVKRVATLFEYKAADARIQFHFQIPDKSFIIHADQQQIEQAFINIIKNAIEAIKADGKIIIASDADGHKLTITDSGREYLINMQSTYLVRFLAQRRMGRVWALRW